MQLGSFNLYNLNALCHISFSAWINWGERSEVPLFWVVQNRKCLIHRVHTIYGVMDQTHCTIGRHDPGAHEHSATMTMTMTMTNGCSSTPSGLFAMESFNVGEPRSHEYLLQCISIAVWRGNATAVLSTMGRPQLDSWEVLLLVEMVE